MRTTLTKSILLVALAGVTLTLPACAGRKAKKDTSYVARDVNTLYAAAKEKLEKGDFKLAAVCLVPGRPRPMSSRCVSN